MTAQRIGSSKEQNEVRRQSETSGGDVGGRLSHCSRGIFRQLNLSQCLKALLKWVKEKIGEECIKRERKCLWYGHAIALLLGQEGAYLKFPIIDSQAGMTFLFVNYVFKPD